MLSTFHSHRMTGSFDECGASPANSEHHSPAAFDVLPIDHCDLHDNILDF